MYKKIMVTLDGSELAECVLPHVDELVTCPQLETILFVRVVELTTDSEISIDTNPRQTETLQKNIKMMEAERKSSAEQYLEEVISRVRQGEVEYKADVLVGQVAESLVDYADANEVELILIATHGRSGISRLVRGSIAESVLRSAHVPVLMVRAQDKLNGGKV
jgi:nucleotide-binding universal stress UspA family protein